MIGEQTKAVEDLLFDFLIESQIATTFDSTVKVLPHPYFDLLAQSKKFNKDDFFVIGDAHGGRYEDGIHGWMEYNIRLTIDVQSRITNKDKTERVPARQRIFEIKNEFIKLIDANKKLNDRVCSVEIDFENRMFEDTRAEKWAVQPVGLIFNRRGK
jgi:hypothetical protein